jgi:hypothetical protein
MSSSRAHTHVHRAFSQAFDRLVEEYGAVHADCANTLFPTYTDDEGEWLWTKKGGPSKYDQGCVWEIITVLFGVWARCGMGHVENERWKPVHVFLPQTLPGKNATERSAGYFSYRCPDNNGVSMQMR